MNNKFFQKITLALIMVLASCGSNNQDQIEFLNDKPASGNLSVVLGAPKGEEIPIDVEGITVMFDDAMIPLTTLDAGRSAALPLKIEPEIDAKASWLGTRGFILRPLSPLKPATKYKVTLPKGLTSISGKKIEQDFSWEFSTVTPRVLSVSPGHGEYVLPKAPRIKVVFNVSMDTKNVEQALSLKTEQGIAVAPNRKLTWSEDNHVLDIDLGQELPWNEDFNFIIPAGIKGAVGELISKTASEQHFSTPAREVEITKVSVHYDTDELLKENHPNSVRAWSPICVTFSQPIEPESFKQSFVASLSNGGSLPTPPHVYFLGYDSFWIGDVEGYDTDFLEGYKTACVSFLDDGETQYELNLDTAKIRGVLGSQPKQEKRKYAITSGPIPESLASGLDNPILSSNKTPLIPYHSNNVSKIRFNLYSVSREQYSEDILSRRVDSYKSVYSASLAKSVTIHPPVAELSYRTMFEIPMLDGFFKIDQMRMPTISSFEVPVELQKNKSVKTLLDVHDFSKFMNRTELAPGFYLIEAVAESSTQSGRELPAVYSMIQVAPYAIAIKREINGVIVWVTDIETGEPVANAPLQLNAEVNNDANTKFQTLATTGPDGLARVSLKDNPNKSDINNMCVLVNDPEKYSYACESLHEIGSYRNTKSRDKNSFVYIYTDRPIYKPGHVVKYSSFVRQVDDARYFLHDPEISYDVIVRDAAGNTIESRSDVKPEEGGIIRGEFTIPDADATPRGAYQISIGESGDYVSHSKTFYVRSYRKPTFKVAVKNAKPEILNGDTIAMDVNASYYFDAPLKEASARWSLMTSTYQFYPEGFEDFTFIDHDLVHSKNNENGDEIYYSDFEYNNVAEWPHSEDGGSSDDPRGSGALRQASNPFKNSGEKDSSQKMGKMDDNGSLNVSYQPNIAEYPFSQVLTFEASVMDPAEQEVSAAEDIVVHKAEHYVGVRPTMWVYGEGTKADFDIVSLNTKGKPVGGVGATVEFVEREYQRIKRRNARGDWQVIYEESDKVLQTQNVTTDSNGKAKIAFQVPKSGTFRVVLKSKDSRGNEIQAAETIYAWGSGYAPWRLDEPEKIELVADKSEYKVGETAKILIKSVLPLTKALVSYDRGHILAHEIKSLGGNASVIEVPILEGMVPNFYVNVMAHAGRGPSNPPRLYYGEAQVVVSPESKRLGIDLKVDKLPVGNALAQYKPGDKVELSLETKTPDGKPIPAHVIVSVADQSVLSLLDYRLPDLVKKFFYLRSNEVLNASSLGSLKAGDGSKDKKVRKLFQDTAHFEAHVQTDVDGKGTVSFTLPDDLTTWNVEAVAVSSSKTLADFEAEKQNVSGVERLKISDNTFVGSSRTQFQTTLPVLTRLALPRFVATDDVFRAELIVTNRQKSELSAKAKVRVTGMGFLADKKMEQELDVVVPAESEKTFAFDVTADKNFGNMTIAADLSSGSKNFDAIENSIAVKVRSAPEVVATSGVTSDKSLEKLSPANDVMADRGGLKVRVRATLAAGMIQNLRGLIYFPWGCAEQKSSSIFGLVMARQLTEKLGEPYFDQLAPLSKKDLDNAVGYDAKMVRLNSVLQTAIDELFSKHQSWNGGLRYWSNSFEPDAWTSLNALWILDEAKRLGVNVNETALNNLSKYVLSMSDHISKNWGMNSRAFALWVYSRRDVAPGILIESILRDRDQLDPDGLAYALLAAKNYTYSTLATDFWVGRLQAATPNIKAKLESLAQHDSRSVLWKLNGFGNASTTNRVTSIAAWSLLKLDEKNPLVPKALAHLFNRKKTRLGYISTQDVLYQSLFMRDVLQITNEWNTDSTGKVDVAKNRLLDFAYNKDNLLSEFSASLDMEKLLKMTSPADVEFSKTGTGSLYYDLEYTYHYAVGKAPIREEGLVVNREFYEMNDKKFETPLSEFKEGQTYKARLTLMTPKPRTHVLIQDLLPAGFEPVDMTLATTSRADAANMQENSETEFGDYLYDDQTKDPVFGTSWTFTHQEIRDDSIVWSDEYVSEGTHVIVYPVRATRAGTYVQPGAEAFEFYEPEIFGRSRQRIIKILPRE